MAWVAKYRRDRVEFGIDQSNDIKGIVDKVVLVICIQRFTRAESSTSIVVLSCTLPVRYETLHVVLMIGTVFMFYVCYIDRAGISSVEWKSSVWVPKEQKLCNNDVKSQT